jgi:hypothetical protein
MEIKYLSDAKGNITGVFIPIEEWERLQKQYKFSDDEPAPANKQFQKGLTDALKDVKLDDSDA